MPPVVVFGSPVQRSKEEAESLWHIPATLHRSYRVGPTTLDDCAFYLDEYEGNECVISMPLMVGDVSFTSLQERVQLVTDRVFLVPVAWRSEKDGDMCGYITDTRYFIHKKRFHLLSPDRKKHRYRLRVKYGNQSQISPHFYLLRVPTISSNGHFVLEIEYEGEGSR